MNKEEFIQKAQIVHNNKYNYNTLIYKSLYQISNIKCPIHGEFQQKLYAHLRGAGCQKCSLVKKSERFRLSIEKFIEKANKIHNNKYDYSNVQYINNRDFIDIICPIHGKFEQRVLGHLQGYGCFKCGIENKYYTTETFIKKAKIIHDNKYNYSKVIYKHSQNKVIIICPEHGEFIQVPNMHLTGTGCPKCANDSRKLTQEEFIIKIKEIHGDRYDYSKVMYKNAKCKIIITCKEHGDFIQTARAHLSGQGCPLCGPSKGEHTIAAILHNNNIIFLREYKLPELNTRHRYDFYLPDYNTLIEFQGIQHYKAIDYFGGEESLKYIKENDKLKRNFATMFNYKLIEFNYKQLKNLSKEDFDKLVLSSIDR